MNWDEAAWIFRLCFDGWHSAHYDGYILVEQDVLPGMGMPKESARRNREYLQIH